MTCARILSHVFGLTWRTWICFAFQSGKERCDQNKQGIQSFTPPALKIRAGESPCANVPDGSSGDCEMQWPSSRLGLIAPLERSYGCHVTRRADGHQQRVRIPLQLPFAGSLSSSEPIRHPAEPIRHSWPQDWRDAGVAVGRVGHGDAGGAAAELRLLLPVSASCGEQEADVQWQIPPRSLEPAQSHCT